MRMKIVVGNFLAVVLVAVVSFFLVHSRLQSGLIRGLDVKLANEQVLFDRSWRYETHQFLSAVEQQASSSPVRVVFSALDEKSRRRSANIASEQISQSFLTLGDDRHAPDVVLVTDETGKVIARDKDVNRMFGQMLTNVLPTLLEVVRTGSPRYAIWWKQDENKLLRTGIAPVRGEQGAVVGTVVVAFDLSNGLAKSEGQLLGRDFVFLMADKVYSSSLPGGLANGLRRRLFTESLAETEGALSGRVTNPRAMEVNGSDYLAIMAPLPQAGSVRVAYVILANRTEELRTAQVAYLILMVGLLGVVFVVVYGFVVGSSIMRPIEQIEEGVLAVINGKTASRLEVNNADLGGLAYRINQLINMLTGVADPDERGFVTIPPGAMVTADPTWQRAEFGALPPDSPPKENAAVEVIDDAAIAEKLAQEPRDAYLARLFLEYVQAKRAIGESVEQLSQERFAERLAFDESRVSAKHQGRGVRFQVSVGAGQVRLVPVLLR